ncbi:LptF/LptG family permease [Xylophilus sp. GOD-11R]|uniref:LptF/LptG family permease n=1 Tax=Xylophilus sp. GOD-11R TaxID=3089814 RepID=UPI00298BC969|nr:LptF/LptG family permease [Xylophilus sp. GOD-11R]WPB58956.1 LptF/LptG family permease [Xylophilus sp. GOD-11R]
MPAYFRQRVGSQILVLLLVITALMQLLELLDVTTDVLKRDLGVLGILYYGALRVPADIVTALPPAVLIGTLLALSSMARNLEIVTMRAAGVGMSRMLAYLLPVGLALAIGQFALTELVLPGADNQLKTWWSASAPDDDTPTRLWAHTKGGTVSMDRISPDAHELMGVRLYVRNAEGLMVDRVVATRALWDGKAWQLQGVTEIGVSAEKIVRTHVADREWDTNLRPDDVLRLDVDRPNLSTMMLAQVIEGTRAGTLPHRYYETVLYRSFAAPLGIFVMLLLALPTAAVLPRSGGGGRAMGIALVLGLLFLLCDGMIAALGTSSRWPPAVIALAAPVLFAAIGLLQLHSCERI